MSTPTDNRPRRLVEDRLAAALRDTAMQTVPATRVPPRPLTRPDLSSLPARHRLRFVAMGLAAAAVAGLAVGLALTLPSSHSRARPPAASHTRPNPAPMRPVIVGHFCDNFLVSPCTGGHEFEPLWPFTSYTQARAWRDQHATEGATAWQYDARQVANHYLHDVLGFRDMNVISYPHAPIRGHIKLDLIVMDFGYRSATEHPQAVGDIELGRYGPDRTYPWEVLGAGRTNSGFTFTQPRSAAVVVDEIRVSGRGAPANAAVHIAVLNRTKRLSTAAFQADTDGRWTGVVALPPPGTANSAGSANSRRVITIVASVGQNAAHPTLIAVRGVEVG